MAYPIPNFTGGLPQPVYPNMQFPDIAGAEYKRTASALNKAKIKALPMQQRKSALEIGAMERAESEADRTSKQRALRAIIFSTPDTVKANRDDFNKLFAEGFGLPEGTDFTKGIDDDPEKWSKAVQDAYYKMSGEKQPEPSKYGPESIAFEEAKARGKPPTGDVGQFYEVHGRRPKNTKELADFKKALRDGKLDILGLTAKSLDIDVSGDVQPDDAKRIIDTVQKRKVEVGEAIAKGKPPTGDVGQFYEVYKRKPKNAKELGDFNKAVSTGKISALELAAIPLKIDLSGEISPEDAKKLIDSIQEKKVEVAEAMGGIRQRQALEGKTEAQTAKIETALKTDPQALDDAIEEARKRLDKYAWEDLNPEQRKTEGRKILDQRIKMTFGNDVQYGKVAGVLGWYKPGPDGKPVLIRRAQ